MITVSGSRTVGFVETPVERSGRGEDELAAVDVQVVSSDAPRLEDWKKELLLIPAQSNKVLLNQALEVSYQLGLLWF